MPAPRRRASFPPSAPTPAAPWTSAFRCCAASRPFTSSTWPTWGSALPMSISLIVRDRLWGLISCLNHTGPRRVSHEMRAACEFLGRLTSLQIARARGPRAARAARLTSSDRGGAGRRDAGERRGGQRARGPARPPEGADGARGRRGGRGGERRGTRDVRPHAAARAHPGHRGVGRRERRAQTVRHRVAGRAVPSGAGGQRRRAVGCSRSLCPALPRGDSCGSARRSSRR